MKKLLLGAAAVLALGFSTTALAATDGTLSATSSTGTFLVNTTLPKLVRISGLSDVTHVFTATEIAAAAAIASYSPVTLPGNNFRVYSNDGTDGAYTLTVSGPTGPAGGNENFGLVGGTSGGRIPMRVIVSDNPTNEFQDTALTGGNVLPNGTAVSGYLADKDGAHRPYTLDCSDVGKDAAVWGQFPVGGLLSAVADQYTGTITIVVSPT